MKVWRVSVGVFLSTVVLISSAAQPRAVAPDFVPEEVFAGRSVGQGTLEIVFRKPRPLTVESTGALREDGAFVLDQRVQFEGRPAESRSWIMRRTGPDTYAATLTDAAGPVTARITGRRLTLRYRLSRWGIVMHQTLDLSEDGRTVRNHGRLRLLGVPFGELHETIHLHH
jgi:hypothetical protein